MFDRLNRGFHIFKDDRRTSVSAHILCHARLLDDSPFRSQAAPKDFQRTGVMEGPLCGADDLFIAPFSRAGNLADAFTAYSPFLSVEQAAKRLHYRRHAASFVQVVERYRTGGMYL